MKAKFTAFFLMLAGAVLAPALASAAAGPQFPVERIKLAYAQAANPKLPSLDGLGTVAFHLATSDGRLFTATEAKVTRPADAASFDLAVAAFRSLAGPGADPVDFGVDLQSVFPPDSRLDASAVREISAAIVARFNQAGIYGVFVKPSETEIDTKGADLRSADNRALTLVIWVSEIAEVRTVAKGDRLAPGDKLVDNAAHQRILENSPLKASAAGVPTDFLNAQLDDYLRRLNRQPGRRVEASVSPATKKDDKGNMVPDPGKVVLDYLVNEGRPWNAYAQLSDTGGNATGRWRERVGVTNNQLFGRDDIASLDYITSDLSTANALFGSYDYPLIFPDKLRLRGYGSWGDFDATTPFLAGGGTSEFTGSSWTGGLDLTASPFAYRGIAFTIMVGATSEHIKVNDLTLGRSGAADLLTPHIELRASRENQISKLSAGFGWETNLKTMTALELQKLGRLNTTDKYSLWHADVSYSTYLEPLLYGISPNNSWEHSTLAHEVSVSLRGQIVPGSDRLIPQKEQAVGGFYSVRGYPESVVAGDNMMQASLEYLFHVPRALAPATEPGGTAGDPQRFFGRPFSYRPARPYAQPDWDLILRAYVDGGMTSVNAPTATESNHHLLGAGFGAELKIFSNLDVRLDVGFALRPLKTGLTAGGVYTPGANDVRAGDTQFHFSTTLVW